MSVRWNRAAAFALVAGAGIAGWWPVLGSGLLWSAPIAVAACLVVAGASRARTGAALLALWIPASLLLAGLPAGALRPRELGATGSSLGDGAVAIVAAGGGRIVGDPWALAVALLAAGVTWCVAALLATGGPARTATALVVLLHPVLGAVLLESTPANAAWHGAVLLAAAVLWTTRGRLALALPIAVAVSLVAVAGAQAFGPRDRWLSFDGVPRKPQFTRLDPTQSYGPLTSRRTGATMFEVRSPEPALWRMQVLEEFDGGGWRFDRGRVDLPEPASVPVTTTVRYAGLTNRLIPAPGRITEVNGPNDGEPSRGESWRFTERPSEGAEYRVTSRVVRATAEELAKVPIPEGETYDSVTRFWPRRVTDGRVEPLAKLADHMPAWVAVSPWADAIRLARRLSAGTTSELEVVRRVEAYLTGGRYRYTTDVDEPGPDPLLEFLFKTRAGYCQHFAGAATLLLRVAGIPTRVVSGFATGRRTGQDTYAVRDEDAHAWIEVYFPGYGWVPFNPTPADAEAEVAPEVDVLAAASRASGGGSGTPLAAAGVLGVVLVGAAVGARRRRSPVALGELLAGLAGESVGPSTTLSALRPRLAAIGPSIVALADQAERMRFAADGTPEPAYPRVRVWRALARERGALRATLMSARLATRPAPAARS